MDKKNTTSIKSRRKNILVTTTNTTDMILRMCSQNSTRSSTRQRRRHANTNTMPVHTDVKANTSISSEEPSSETRSARSFQLSLAIHHETTDKKMEQQSQTGRTRFRHEPLQPQICRPHCSRWRLTKAHDHHARRPRHSYDGTRLATPPHEHPNHLQYGIKARKRQQFKG